MDKDMRRKIDMIKDELVSRGHDVIEHEVVKNGIRRYALIFKVEGSNMAPTIYVDRIIVDADEKHMAFRDIIELIEQMVKENTVKTDFDVKEIVTKENLLKNSRIIAQKISDDGGLKKPGEFEGTEYVLKLRINLRENIAYIKINREILDFTHTDEDELWQQAMENTKRDTVIVSMTEMMEANRKVFEELGADMEIMHSLRSDENMYIVSNSDGKFGASAILNKDAIRELGERIGVSRFAVIPSSVHECLLIPNPSEDMDIEEMTRTTNIEAVDQEEQLADKPIYINFMEV